jgi:hypothetical protein
MLLIDRAAALGAIPAMLPKDIDMRRKAVAVLRQVMGAAGDIGGESAQRLEEVARLFGLDEEPAANVQNLPTSPKLEGTKAS